MNGVQKLLLNISQLPPLLSSLTVKTSCVYEPFTQTFFLFAFMAERSLGTVNVPTAAVQTAAKTQVRQDGGILQLWCCLMGWFLYSHFYMHIYCLEAYVAIHWGIQKVNVKMAQSQHVPMATLTRDEFRVGGLEMFLWRNTRCGRQDFDPGKRLSSLQMLVLLMP